MPLIATIPAALATSAAVGAGSAVATGLLQRSAANNATKAQTAANRRALEIERENEARRQYEWERTESENQRRWNESSSLDQWRYNQEAAMARRKEQQDVDVYNITKRQRQPYVDTSLAAVQSLAKDVGLIVTPSDAPQLSRPSDYVAPSLADILKTGAPRA